MAAEISKSPVIIGISLKMYFGHQQTVDWCESVAEIARSHRAVIENHVQLFVLPSMPSLGTVAPILHNAGIGMGAQDLYHEDKGAYTGEVGGEMLRELGCDFVEIGHAERRRLFGETDEVVAEKTAAAIRNSLTPVLCVGEEENLSAMNAAALCIRQIEASGSKTDDHIKLLVAYEPIWAIGAEKPASKSHIIEVCQKVSEFLNASGKFSGSRVIYGGSAGPGLLTELNGRIAGMFLGRFAHDPSNLVEILDEVVELHQQKPLSA